MSLALQLRPHNLLINWSEEFAFSFERFQHMHNHHPEICSKWMVLLRCCLMLGNVVCMIGIVNGQFLNEDTSDQKYSAVSENAISVQRLSQPLRWVYDDHPIAQPILIGNVNPFVWGLLILLASLYATLALTPARHLKPGFFSSESVESAE